MEKKIQTVIQTRLDIDKPDVHLCRWDDANEDLLDLGGMGKDEVAEKLGINPILADTLIMLVETITEKFELVNRDIKDLAAETLPD